MSRVERPEALHVDVFEVLVGGEEQVGGALLVGVLIVRVGAGPPWQEEPLLMHITPSPRLVDHVAC